MPCQSINHNSFRLKQWAVTVLCAIIMGNTTAFAQPTLCCQWWSIGSTKRAHNSGITRLQETLRFHFYHPKLLAEVHAQISRCDICQHMKRGSRQYGLLAPRDAKSAPWSDVAINCIRPWVIELHGSREYSLCALTTIDVTTNLLEINPILTQTAVECAQAFENGWLLHYP